MGGIFLAVVSQVFLVFELGDEGVLNATLSRVNHRPSVSCMATVQSLWPRVLLDRRSSEGVGISIYNISAALGFCPRYCAEVYGKPECDGNPEAGT